MRGQKGPKIPPGGVPIVGQKKYVETHTLEVGGVKLHPPVDPHVGHGVQASWIMTYAQLVGISNDGRAALAEFGFELLAFLAAPHPEIGQKYDMVLLQPTADGGINITKQMPPAPPGN